MSSRRLLMMIAVVAVAVVILGAAIATAVASSGAAKPFEGTPTRRSLDEGWSIQSSSGVDAPPRVVSQPGFSTADWFPVTLPSTVLAGLVANGEYDDLYVGTNLERVWGPRFDVPWWYRTEFALDDQQGARTQLHFDGINYRADIYVNGTRVADHDRVAGTFRTYTFDVTAWSTRGRTPSPSGCIRSTHSTTSRSRGSTGARSPPTAAWGSGTTCG